MKKLLVLTAILAMTVSAQAFAADENTTVTQKTAKQQCTSCPKKMHRPPMAPGKVDFDKKLKLTDEQKAKAKEIHQKGFEEIKPIAEKLSLKREEIAAVKRSQISPEEQAQKIVQLRKECKELKHQMREIQMKNMKEFEAILTDKQKAELKKIKEEGRKKFERAHKKSPLRMPPREGFDDGRPTPVNK